MFKVSQLSKMMLFIKMDSSTLLSAFFPNKHKAVGKNAELAKRLSCVKGAQIAVFNDDDLDLVNVDDYKVAVKALRNGDAGIRISKSNWRKWKMSQV